MSTKTTCFLHEALDDAEAHGYGKVLGKELVPIRVVRGEEARRLKRTVIVDDTGNERRICLLDTLARKPGAMIMKLRKL